MYRILNHHLALAGHGGAVAGNPGGQDAVKHVHTPEYSMNQTIHAAYSHEITGFVDGHPGNQMIQHIVHGFLGFTHAEAANAVSGKIHPAEALLRCVDGDH
jgi:hypothetical protein